MQKQNNDRNNSSGNTSTQKSKPKGSKSNKQKTVRQQPRKDSNSKRVNFDNARVSRVEKDIKEDSKRYNANDASEYNKNPELVKAAGSVPFAVIAGSPVYSGNGVPGVLSLCWTPAYGPGPIPVALNQAGDAYYSEVVHANSRNTSYTAPDLMICTLAGMEVFDIIGAAMRAYGTALAYQEENRYLPNAVLAAQGFEPVNFRQNLSQIWFDINNFVNQSRQIWIPNVFPLMEHWFRLNSHVYTDAPGKRSQIYIPVRSRYFMFSETGYKTGSGLIAVNELGKAFGFEGDTTTSTFIPGIKQYTWEQWKTVIQALIDALINSEDRGVMYGDILKCYGAERLYSLPAMDVGFTVYPDYNAEFLMQIENTNFAATMFAVMGVIQNEEDIYPGYSASELSTVTAAGVTRPPLNPLMNVHIDSQPSPEMVMVASRNMLAGVEIASPYMIPTGQGGVTPAKAKAWTLPCTGTEVFHRAIMYYTFDSQIESVDITPRGSIPGDESPLTYLRLMAFDWHPFIYDLNDSLLPMSNSGAKVGLEAGTVSNAFGDYDNYTIISKDMLRKLHDVAVYSLFGVPHM